jgi:hypothetical protein
MRWRLLLPLVILALFLFPSVALAQGSTTNDDVLMRVNGPISVGANETAGTVVVISDNADISGIVKHDLVVVDGNATVSGTIEGTVTVVSGTLNLQPAARVAGDVNLVRSDMTRASGATIEGSITRSSFDWSGWNFLIFSVYLWISFTIAIIIAGLIFAAVGGRQLTSAGNLIAQKTGGTIIAAIIVGIGVPILAVVAMLTVLGIPLGIGLLLFLIPALWFFGYLVAGTKLGSIILRQDRSDHPYVAALLGLVLLQVIGLVPFLGGLVTFIAGILGTGALALLAWNAWRGPDTASPARAEFAEPAPGD